MPMNDTALPSQVEPAALADFVTLHPRLFVLTGAGLSTASGIPDYRDADGQWKNAQPIQYRDFIDQESARRRYWARSLIGWPRFAAARPNPAHVALAELERRHHVRQLVTQNVDGLHQRAGNQRVIDLHGRLDRVDCLECGARWTRDSVQRILIERNPAFVGAAPTVASAPDGDARLETDGLEGFQLPDCSRCGGLLKPAVVFFGESVPRQRVAAAMQALSEADALLVVGSSLMVYSGFRFCQAAVRQGKPIAAINLGRTRADDLFSLKLALPCDQALTTLLAELPG